MEGGDLVGQLEALLAKGLFAIDRSCSIAKALQEQGVSYSSIDRALRIRQAIEGTAGVRLPELHRFGEGTEDAQSRQRDEAAFLLEAGLPLTTREIADLAGVERTTVMRWAQRSGGEIWAKLRDARRQGDPVRFTPDEVRALLQAGGGE